MSRARDRDQDPAVPGQCPGARPCGEGRHRRRQRLGERRGVAAGRDAAGAQVLVEQAHGQRARGGTDFVVVVFDAIADGVRAFRAVHGVPARLVPAGALQPQRERRMAAREVRKRFGRGVGQRGGGIEGRRVGERVPEPRPEPAAQRGRLGAQQRAGLRGAGDDQFQGRAVARAVAAGKQLVGFDLHQRATCRVLVPVSRHGPVGTEAAARVLGLQQMHRADHTCGASPPSRRVAPVAQ